MLYALVLLQVANIIVVTTITPNIYYQPPLTPSSTSSLGPILPKQYQQKRYLIWKNYTLPRQVLQQKHPQRRQSQFGPIVVVPINVSQHNFWPNGQHRPLATNNSRKTSNNNSSSALVKKRNQINHLRLSSSSSSSSSSYVGQPWPRIDQQSPQQSLYSYHAYPLWKINFESKTTNNNHNDLISTSLSSTSTSSSSSSSSSLSTSSSDDLNGPELIFERTAPDTSAGLFAKAIDNVIRFLPSRIRDRQNPGCVGGTKCQFFVVCWMSGGSLGASCGPLHTCCVTPSSQDIQPKYWGPVINDPQCGKSAARISRIVGGSDASFGQFPWQAFVQVGGSRCGGALVGPAHVVTAGHCVARSQHNPSSIRVTLGDYILHSEIESLPHEVFTVSEVKLHPNFRFTPQADRYDVAVLVLDRSVQYRENIMPICLPPKGTISIGRNAYVAGWGALQAGSKLRPKVLQHVPVPVIENNICETWHKQRGINIKIYDEMMCAGYETGGKDACQGDSGGPLMLNEFGVWYLIGIVSAGYSCAKQYQPGIYHRVSSSSDWVSANVFPSAHYRLPS